MHCSSIESLPELRITTNAPINGHLKGPTHTPIELRIALQCGDKCKETLPLEGKGVINTIFNGSLNV